MKKILLLTIVISWTFNSSAQCNSSLPIYEDFNDPNTINVCWSFIDNDTDGYNWTVTSLGGNNGLVSNSWTPSTGPLNPDNWVITNAIDLTSYSSGSAIQLNWDVRTPDWSFDKERYSVYAATGNQISNFLASSVSMYDDLDNSDAAGLNFASRSLDLSSLAGETIYVAFRHHNSTDQNKIDIDNFTMSGTLSSDDFAKQNFKHYYNSTNDNLVLKSSTAPISSIKIYNILGQSVVDKPLSKSNETINLSTLVDGIYIAQVEINNSTKSIKFLKQ
ncbi:choice-of-anchor J domain-containing protein [Geojedonia litorea]|uniref:Choice-of-anchor J domain-containing protein n=1 Tax=Geojedonia litorea TaxID=1268269 RepID=A0ABV9N6Y4_9FLAO